MARRRRHFIKRAIDAVADFEFVFERLEMNVACVVLDRLIQNEIDKSDDRRCVRLCFNRSLAVSLAQLQRFAGFAELLEHFLHARRVGAVILFNQFFDLLWRRDHYLYLFAKCETQVFGNLHIKRIDQRHAQRGFAHVNRQRAVQPRQSARNETQNLRRDLAFAQIDEFRAQAVGNGFIKARLIDKAAVDHRLRNRFSVQFHFVQHVIGLRRLQYALLNEKFGELFFGHLFG